MTSPKPTREKNNRPKPNSHNFSAEEKAQAVLAVWTERCKAATVCRQLEVTAMTFYQWQQRAMEGMLQALESRVNLAEGKILSPRLQTLLLKRRSAAAGRLSARLEHLQNKVANSGDHPAQKS